MAKINYEKLGIRVCCFCGEDYKPAGPAQESCTKCRELVKNIDRQVSMDITRYKKFKTYESIGKGNVQGSGKYHHSYKNGLGLYQKIGRDLKESIGFCERCGKDLSDAGKGCWCTHHKDKDRSNNSIDNLELLCKRCHQLEHDCINNLPNEPCDISATTISEESTPK